MKIHRNSGLHADKNQPLQDLNTLAAYPNPLFEFIFTKL